MILKILLMILLMIFVGLIVYIIYKILNESIKDEEYEEYSQTIYVIGISMFTGSMLKITYSSNQTELIDFLPFFIGSIFIIIKNKIKHKSRFVTIMSGIILILYVFMFFRYKLI